MPRFFLNIFLLGVMAVAGIFCGKFSLSAQELIFEDSDEYEELFQNELLFAYDYDEQSRTLAFNFYDFSETTDPANYTFANTYNGFGERINLRNRRNSNYVFGYDTAGRLISTKTPAVANPTTQTWNAERNLVDKVKKPSGKETNYTYDSLGRIKTQSDQAGTITFSYDNNGNPLTITEGTNTLTRTWDGLNRPLTYKNAAGEIIYYAYNQNGQIEKITYPGGFYVSYTYTKTGRLSTVKDSAGRTTTYTWDILGRLTKLTRPNGTTRTNTYDAGSRLISFQERSAAGDLLAYSSFAYDADGRLINRYRLPSPGTTISQSSTAATYDADNRLQTWNGTTVTHDADGNMTSGPLALGTGSTNYTYDARNRLTALSGINYTYDAENNRLTQTTSAGTTRYTVDPHGDALPRVLIRTKPDGTKTHYVYGIGLAYEVNESTGQATYYHFDHQGSTAALTNQSASVTDRFEYGVYGHLTYRSGSTDTPYQYIGQLGVETDPNGLLYMRARYYNPQIMRFINADPIGFAGGMNWYGYAGNNPMQLIDPNGFAPQSIGAQFKAVIAAAIKMLPGVESIDNAITSAGQGRYGAALGHLALGALDVGSTFMTGGASAAAKVGVKVAAKGGAKAAAKVGVRAAERAGGRIVSQGGVIRQFTQESNQVYYRVFSGYATKGSWLTAVKPKSSAWAQEALALPSNNKAQFIQEVLVPKGTLLERSRAIPVPHGIGSSAVLNSSNFLNTLLQRISVRVSHCHE